MRNKFFVRHRDALIILSTVLLVFAAMLIFKLPCPIKHLTGLSCAGCGMTRACLAALSLDFAAAFELHPLWIALPFIALLLLVFNIKGWRRASNIALICAAILFFAVWIFRLAAGDSVVAFDFDNSVIKKITELL